MNTPCNGVISQRSPVPRTFFDQEATMNEAIGGLIAKILEALFDM